MTTGTTGQLGLALPVQGELSGTWGDTVNNGITQYTNIAIAGTLTLTNDGAVTLANTTGDASASNITSTLAGAGTVTAQFAVVRVSGTTTTKVITGPSYSKTYLVDNASSFAVTFKASGQTGVSVAAAEKVSVYFNGTDYVKIAGTIANAAGSNTQIQFNNGGLFGASANLTWDGTKLSTTQVNITGQGPLRLEDTTGGEYVGLRSPSALGASYTLTFPADDGTSGQALITDGSGVLSWSTAASGDVYGPASATANGIALFDGTTGKLLKDSASTNGLIYGLTVGRGASGVSSNTAFGVSALAANTSGSSSVAVGNGALIAQTSGDRNVAIGESALSTNITGVRNTAVGHVALAANTGSYNTAHGAYALFTNTTASNNTAVGYEAGYSNTTGGPIDAFGLRSLYSNTIGYYNVAIGAGSLFSNTTGNQNTALGYTALNANTTASNNTAVGFEAGKTNTTGEYCVAVGAQALYSSNGVSNTGLGWGAGYSTTSGTNNLFAGATSGYANTTGSFNVALGQAALRFNTTGSSNTAVGYQAAYSNTTAGGGTIHAFGNQALYSNTTGANNTGFGNAVLYSTTTGNSNVAMGSAAGYNNTTGSFNTGLGHNALFANTTASNNTAVGYQAGYTNQTGNGNTFIGQQAGYTSNVSGNAFNTCIGHSAGYSLTTGVSNTFIGVSATVNSSGSLITTGSKNSILGPYSGNQDGLDIRTASKVIVLSDGDGYPAFWGVGGSTGYMRLQAGRLEFPPTANPSTDPNTLDDYEEGTWTPSLGGFSDITYSARTGTYTKIGNVVNVVCKMVVTGGTRTAADAQVFSLPFTSASQENSGGSWGYGFGVVASSVGLPQLRINASGTTVSLLNTAGAVLSGTDLNTATPTINFSATYTV
jgi:hypothetical protein